DLRYTRSRSDQRFQVLSRKTLLLHAELDRLDRIGRIHRVVLRLVGVNQRRQHVESVALGRSAFRAPQTLDIGKSPLVVRLGSNWLQLTRHIPPPSRRSGRRP